MPDKKKTIEIFGVPSDLGANIQGALMGPPAIRISGLKKQIEAIGYDVLDRGNLEVPVRDALGPKARDTFYLEALTVLCQDLCQKTKDSMAAGHLPLVLGGDHSLAIGSISGISSWYASEGKKTGLIWVDAHADINTPESSDSGNIHGMPLATLLGRGHKALTDIGFAGAKVRPENVALLAIRNIDSIEKELLRKSGISFFTMRDIDEQGMYPVMQQALAVATRGTDAIHLSFDLDGIDPRHAPGVSTPVVGGLNFREAHLLLEMLAETGRLGSMEFVELNPYTDHDAQTSKLTVDLICSALGKSII